MVKTTPPSTAQLIKDLQVQVKKLQSELKTVTTVPAPDLNLLLKVHKVQERFRKVKDSKGEDVGTGEFFYSIDITAAKETLYVPISIASGVKATGFVYQIEGTAEGSIFTTDISCRGEEVTQIKLGTILYSKIPAGKTATFRILIEIRGKIHKAYKIVIHRINYKFNPTDTRYVRYEKELTTKMITFK